MVLLEEIELIAWVELFNHIEQNKPIERVEQVQLVERTEVVQLREAGKVIKVELLKRKYR